MRSRTFSLYFLISPTLLVACGSTAFLGLFFTKVGEGGVWGGGPNGLNSKIPNYVRANRWGPWWALDKVQQCRVHIAHLLRQKHILIPAFSSLEKTATFPFIYSGAVCCRDAQQTTLKFLFRPEFSDLKLENTAQWKNENKLIFRYSGTGSYKPPFFFWSATTNSQISKWIYKN